MEVLVLCVCVWCHSLHVLLISQDFCISANIPLKMAPEICLFAFCNSACVWMPTNRKKQNRLPSAVMSETEPYFSRTDTNLPPHIQNKPHFSRADMNFLLLNHTPSLWLMFRGLCIYNFGWSTMLWYSVTSKAFISSVVLTLCCVCATEVAQGSLKAVTFANWINFTL